jgi:hypothetical protein
MQQEQNNTVLAVLLKVILAPNTHFQHAFCIENELPNYSSVITALNAQQLVTQVVIED